MNPKATMHVPSTSREKMLVQRRIIFRIVSQKGAWEYLSHFVFSAFNCLKENKSKGIEGLNNDKGRAQRTKKEEMTIEKSSTFVFI